MNVKMKSFELTWTSSSYKNLFYEIKKEKRKNIKFKEFPKKSNYNKQKPNNSNPTQTKPLNTN